MNPRHTGQILKQYIPSYDAIRSGFGFKHAFKKWYGGHGSPLNTRGPITCVDYPASLEMAAEI
jgi:hypothetical protein